MTHLILLLMLQTVPQTSVAPKPDQITFHCYSTQMVPHGTTMPSTTEAMRWVCPQLDKRGTEIPDGWVVHYACLDDGVKITLTCSLLEFRKFHEDGSYTLYHYKDKEIEWQQEIAAPKLSVPQVKQNEPPWVMPKKSNSPEIPDSCPSGYTLGSGDLSGKCWRVK